MGLTAGTDLMLRASAVTAGGDIALTATAGTVGLLAGENTDFAHHTYSRSNAAWQSMRD